GEAGDGVLKNGGGAGLCCESGEGFSGAGFILFSKRANERRRSPRQARSTEGTNEERQSGEEAMGRSDRLIVSYRSADSAAKPRRRRRTRHKPSSGFNQSKLSIKCL
ncbi:unnamed protein product, partial [Phaeothamnion confervicola]